jgi:hypothetical protein
MTITANKQIKTYRVDAWEEMTWSANIEAASKEEAEEKALKHINDFGFDNLWQTGSHGDYSIIDVEEKS